MTRINSVLMIVACFLTPAGLVAGGRFWLALNAAPRDESALDILTSPPLATKNPPRLVIENNRVDAGDVPRGQPAKFAFVLKNEGVGPLVIAAKAGCGCTVVSYEKQIPAGGRGKLEAELRTQNLHDDVTKAIDVQTNDPSQPRLHLELAARVVSALKVLPSDQPTLSLRLDGPTSEELRLQAASTKIAVTEVKCSEPYVKANLLPVEGVGAGRTYRLALTVLPEAPLGKSDFRLTLMTTAKFEPQIAIAVRCEKGIIASPASVRLGVQRANEPGKWVVVLSKRDGSFEIRGVTCSDPRLEARAEVIREGSLYRLAVRCAGKPRQIAAPATITVHTDDPQQPHLQIPVKPASVAQAEQRDGSPQLALRPSTGG